ncbi:MAG: class I SAM-dependent methyltransferase [Campylobacteraceae bacterium]|nr:class I SAM-dependent methyltransferase [Campylobacteraceae bacterium]
MSSRKKWDEKATKYSRFSSSLTPFQTNIFDFIKKHKVDFRDKKIIDIGCGTGVYTLHLALEAREVVGADFSMEMLKIMQNDAKSNGIHNIKTLHAKWDKLELKESFDIAFCSMTPAVGDDKTFKKMHLCAKEKVYLGWGGKRESSFLDPIFKDFNSKYKAPSGGLDLLLWLHKEDISHEHIVLDETRSAFYGIEEAEENAAWHLGINKVEFSQKKLNSLIKNMFQKNDKIENVIKSQMILVVWR